MGVAIVQKMARHIIARMPLINVPRQTLEDEMAHRRRLDGSRTTAQLIIVRRRQRPRHFDVYAYQQMPIARFATMT